MEILNINEEDDLPGAKGTDLGWTKERMEVEIIASCPVFRQGELPEEGMVVIVFEFVDASRSLKPASLEVGVDHIDVNVMDTESVDLNFSDNGPIDVMCALEVVEIRK
jgi:hypothetical protein